MEINKKLLLILPLLLLSCSSENPVDPINLTGYSSESLVHDSLQRQYLMYLPNSYQENTSYPLVINFHGFGEQINEYASYADMRSLADSENFILVYPQGENLNGSPHWNAALMGGNNKSDIDIIFNALHGPWGEDGKIQGLFEYLNIPYTHSGVTASALGMNKQLSKK